MDITANTVMQQVGKYFWLQLKPTVDFDREQFVNETTPFFFHAMYTWKQTLIPRDASRASLTT